jgi:hypothetical protein
MTRLGSATECRKSGRYARLMGDLWRHPKIDQVGDAALGLLTRIWSYCADQGVDRLAEKRMLDLFRGANGRRQLNELLAAGFMEALPEGGYAPHDWLEHNRVAKTVRLRVVPKPAVMKMRGRCDEDVMKPTPEIIQETTVSRARALTQDPGVKEGTPPAGAPAVVVDVPKVPTPKPRKPRSRDVRKGAFRELLGSTCREHGLLARDALRPKQLEAAVAKAEEFAEREGIEFEAAALKLLGEAAAQVKSGQKSALCWAVRDWQPGVQVVRPAYGPAKVRVERAVCSPVEAFGTVEEFEAKWAARRAAREAAHG